MNKKARELAENVIGEALGKVAARTNIYYTFSEERHCALPRSNSDLEKLVKVSRLEMGKHNALELKLRAVSGEVNSPEAFERLQMLANKTGYRLELIH